MYRVCVNLYCESSREAELAGHYMAQEIGLQFMGTCDVRVAVLERFVIIRDHAYDLELMARRWFHKWGFDARSSEYDRPAGRVWIDVLTVVEQANP